MWLTYGISTPTAASSEWLSTATVGIKLATLISVLKTRAIWPSKSKAVRQLTLFILLYYFISNAIRDRLDGIQNETELMKLSNEERATSAIRTESVKSFYLIV